MFANKVGKNFRHFVGIFNKTIIPLALFFLAVGYNMIIARQFIGAPLILHLGQEETQGE